MVSTWISVILKLEKGHSPSTCRRDSSAWPSRISEAFSEALHLEVSGTLFVDGSHGRRTQEEEQLCPADMAVSKGREQQDRKRQ